MAKLFFLLLFSFNLLAEKPQDIGQVAKLQGLVQSSNQASSKTTTLKSGDSVYQGDVILTSERSFVKIILNDDSIFQIGPNSKLVLKNFEQDDLSKKRKSAHYQMEKGSFRAIFTKGKDRNIKVSSPTVAMGIRGTEILSEVFEQNGKMESEVVLLNGKIDLEHLGSKKEIKLIPGQFFSSVDTVSTNDLKVKELPKAYASLFKLESGKGGALFMNDLTRQVKYAINNDINVGNNSDSSDHKKKSSKYLDSSKEMKSFGELLDLKNKFDLEKTLDPEKIEYENINKDIRYDTSSSMNGSRQEPANPPGGFNGYNNDSGANQGGTGEIPNNSVASPQGSESKQIETKPIGDAPIVTKPIVDAPITSKPTIDLPITTKPSEIPPPKPPAPTGPGGGTSPVTNPIKPPTIILDPKPLPNNGTIDSTIKK